MQAQSAVAELQGAPPTNEPGPAPSEARAGIGWRVAVVVAATLGTLVAIVPALFVVWWGYGQWTSIAAAETLELSGGLDAYVFTSCYWLSFGVVVAALVWSGLRVVLRRVHPWRPLFWLVLVDAALLGAVVAPAAWQGVEIPEGFAATVVLMGGWLWDYILPAALLVGVVRLDVAIVRRAMTSSASARRALAGFTVASLAASFMAYGLGVSGWGEDLEADVDAVDAIEGTPLDVRSGHGAYIVTAAAVGSGWRKAPTVEGPFQACMKQLSTARPPDRATVEKSVSKLARSMRLADAQDVAAWTLLEVCRAYEAHGITNLTHYYWGAIRNEAKSFCNKQRNEVPLDPADVPDYAVCTPFRDTVEARELYAALEALPKDQRDAVRFHYIEGRSHAEVAAMVGATEAAVRQRCSRGAEKLRWNMGLD